MQHGAAVQLEAPAELAGHLAMANRRCACFLVGSLFGLAGCAAQDDDELLPSLEADQYNAALGAPIKSSDNYIDTRPGSSGSW